jgi:mycothiol system anti-sigma-R factor
MTPCDDRSLELLRYLDNDLSEPEFKHFRAHLNTCPYCQDRLKAEHALSSVLRESRPLYSAPEELRIEISEAIERHSARNRSQWRWWLHTSVLRLNWMALLPASLAIALCLITAPHVVQNVRAESYLETAVANHNRYLTHQLIPEIRTNSPEAVTAWLADKLPFHFRLPNSEAALDANPTYKLAGASLVNYRGIPAAMVFYEAPGGPISLLVESSKAAVVAGGDEVHFGSLIFHYRNDGRFKVITWRARDLSYALVSSISTSAQESCMVCHQSMRDHGQFRSQP